MITNEDLITRFLNYVRIDTQSADEAGQVPSTARQRDLAQLLFSELKAMGYAAHYDEEHCYVYAEIPGAEPAIGFVAHMDTSPAASGCGVKPRIVEQYDGGDILLNENGPIRLTPSAFPELLSHVGEDLIVTDGTTLLGADDKAGVAEIMSLAAFCAAHPEFRHRAVSIAFTPDEEVGSGTDFFDPEHFRAREAYTVDGGKLGELEYECFNAAAAKVEVTGRSVHPGDAKNKMLHAAAIAMEYHSMLPPAEVPWHTEGYEGFYYVDSIEGDCESATLRFIIRDHDEAKFDGRKKTAMRIADYLSEKYGDGVLRLSIKDQYYNMAIPMRDHMELIDRAKDAMKQLGIEPVVRPIRGGTDGAKLTYEGIPCPNLCTGGYNFHGRFEFASIQEMEACAGILKRIAALDPPEKSGAGA